MPEPTQEQVKKVAGDLAHAAAFAARCRAEEITKDYRKQGDE